MNNNLKNKNNIPSAQIIVFKSTNGDTTNMIIFYESAFLKRVGAGNMSVQEEALRRSTINIELDSRDDQAFLAEVKKRFDVREIDVNHESSYVRSIGSRTDYDLTFEFVPKANISKAKERNTVVINGDYLKGGLTSSPSPNKPNSICIRFGGAYLTQQKDDDGPCR